MAQVGKSGRINGLRRLLIAKVTADTAAAFTLGTAVSLGAQSKLTWKPVKKTTELATSSGLENRRSFVERLTWSLEGGELNLDAMDVVLNGIMYQDGAVGTSKSLYGLKQGLNDGYFAILGQPDLVEGGPADYYVALLKCQADDINGSDLGDGWVKFTASGVGMYPLKDKVLFTQAFLEAKTDITFDVVLTDLAGLLSSGT